MLGYILLTIAIIWLGLAGYYDLRYTEFPDWLPYSLIIVAVATRGIASLVTGNYALFISSIYIGILFLLIGYVIYFLKQWGDGDAWLLGAVGFLFPDAGGLPYSSPLPIYVSLLLNFFLVSFVYLTIYAIFLGARNKRVKKKFIKEIKKSKVFISISFISLTLFIFIFSYFFSVRLGMPLSNFTTFFILPFLYLFISMFIPFARAVEEVAFVKRKAVEKLKVGDVLFDGRWRGLKESEIKELKKKYRFVKVKEGVRFAPVFLLTVLVTVLHGGVLLI